MNSVEENTDNEVSLNNISSPVFRVSELDDTTKSTINGISWKTGCPVDMDDLRILAVSYLDFDSNTKTGNIIVNKSVSEELCDIFKELYENDFKIDKINLIDNYNADDEKSMADNNTSAFCFRTISRKYKIL